MARDAKFPNPCPFCDRTSRHESWCRYRRAMLSWRQWGLGGRDAIAPWAGAATGETSRGAS